MKLLAFILASVSLNVFAQKIEISPYEGKTFKGFNTAYGANPDEGECSITINSETRTYKGDNHDYTDMITGIFYQQAYREAYITINYQNKNWIGFTRDKSIDNFRVNSFFYDPMFGQAQWDIYSFNPQGWVEYKKVVVSYDREDPFRPTYFHYESDDSNENGVLCELF